MCCMCCMRGMFYVLYVLSRDCPIFTQKRLLCSAGTVIRQPVWRGLSQDDEQTLHPRRRSKCAHVGARLVDFGLIVRKPGPVNFARCVPPASFRKQADPPHHRDARVVIFVQIVGNCRGITAGRLIPYHCKLAIAVPPSHRGAWF